MRETQLESSECRDEDSCYRGSNKSLALCMNE